MPAAITKLQLQLQQTSTKDRPARQAALTAVNDMMGAATRAGALLEAARKANMEGATGQASFDKGRKALLARDAYHERTNAEVAKYRAAYALIAEDAGNKAASIREVAAKTDDAKLKSPLVEKAKYWESRRNTMLQASAATTEALKSVPPLPAHVAPQVASNNPALDNRLSVELQGQPNFGWRSSKYSALMGDFFPATARKASASLQGLGDEPVDQNSSSWWTSLEHALGLGVQAAGAAAAQEGQKASDKNPAVGTGLKVGGGVLAVLSNALGWGVSSGAGNGEQTAGPAEPPWGLILLGVGGLVIGGTVLWNLNHKRGKK